MRALTKPKRPRGEPMRLRLGVLAYHPIQYHAPLYQLLHKRGEVNLDVLFLGDDTIRPVVDPGFGLPVAWDVDLLSGYQHAFLSTESSPVDPLRRAWGILRWLSAHDVIVVNGYNSPWMLLAMAACRIRGIPFLLRASSQPEGLSAGLRRHLRRIATRAIVANCSGGLCMGMLNAEFYRRTKARSVTFAPNSVDDERFSRPPSIRRSDLLAKWGLKEDKPVVLFSGKLIPRKRPLDLAEALMRLPVEVTAIFVGDGALAEQVRACLRPGSGVVTGFVNQADLPAYYHAADILVLPSEAETWGLVVNEAMACGVLPVVSDRVGCAPDLVAGVGEIFPCGDVTGLLNALHQAIKQLENSGIRDVARRRVEHYSLEHTAEGFEVATTNAVRQSRRATTRDA